MLKKLMLAATAAGMLIVGCGESSSTTGAPGNSKPKLVYIAKNTGNPYFDPLIAGFKAAAEEQGCDFVTVAPATADATSQIPLIEDQIQQGVGAIALSPNSTDALTRVLDKALAKGIPVITVDSDLTKNEKSRTASVKTADPQSIGEGQVELMGSLIGYSGKFAILSATTDAPNQNEWIGIMKKTLESNPKYKNMQLVETVYGNDEPQKSLTEAEALLTKYPDLKGIVAPTTVGIAAAAQAVETAKKSDTVFVTGLGTPNQMRRFVKDGVVKAFALWSPYDEGYLSGQIAAQLAKKTLEIKPGVKIQAGKLGEREVRENAVIITGPPVVFTKDNIDQFNF